jgi:predicted ATPase/DNA-binding XRE family transcriptional regulator
MANQTSFGEELRRKRRASGLTQDQLSERSGVSIRAITDLERGVVNRPRLDTINLLAEGLDLSSDEREHWQELRRLATPYGKSGRQKAPDLPVWPNRLIGREREIDELLQILRRPELRLVSITGAGGIGKTRVAAVTANRLADDFEHGIRFVDLVPVQSAPSVLPAIATGLHLRYSSDADLQGVISEYLQRRSILLVLDNLEHVIGAAPDIVTIISSSQRSKILVTSRARLQLLVEHEFPLATFRLPDETAYAVGAQNPAIELFAERARQANRSLELTDENLPAIIEICRKLDGLPLAIELAAARTRVMSPEEMLPQIQQRMDLLSSPFHDLPHRHRTLRSTISWSYNLLQPNEQRMLRQLAVFVGSWSLDAVEHICNEAAEIVDTLSALIDSSLVERVNPTAPISRFRMLETIRQFSLEELQRSGEYANSRAAHARYVRDLTQRLSPELLGPDPVNAMEQIDHEMPNIRLALDWAHEHETDLGQELAGSVSWYWLRVKGDLAEARTLIEKSLETPSDSSLVRMRALAGLSWVAHMQQDIATASAAAQESLEIAQNAKNEWYRAWSLHLLGRIAYFDQEPDQATKYAEESLHLANQLGDTWLKGWCFQLLGIARFIAGESALARPYLETSYETWASIDDEFGMAALNALLGVVNRMEGNDQDALELLQNSLLRYRHLGALWFASNFIAEIVTITTRLREFDLAARLSGFVEEGWKQTSAGPAPFTRSSYHESTCILHLELGPESFDRFRDEGRGLTLESAVELALRAGSP